MTIKLQNYASGKPIGDPQELRVGDEVCLQYPHTENARYFRELRTVRVESPEVVGFYAGRSFLGRGTLSPIEFRGRMRTRLAAEEINEANIQGEGTTGIERMIGAGYRISWEPTVPQIQDMSSARRK